MDSVTMFHVELSADLPSLAKMSMVDIDATALISGGIFVIMMIALNQLLFKPYIAIVRERTRLTTGAQESAAATTDKAAAVLSEYEGRLSAARAEAATIREKLRAEGQAAEQEIIAGARDRAAQRLSAQRDELSVALESATSTFEEHVTLLSEAIVTRVTT